MKPLLLTFLLIFASCAKHDDKDTTNDYDEVKAIAARYIEQMEVLDVQALFPDRCDRITFLSLASSILGDKWNLKDHEWSSGEWHRSTSACYPDSSRSEISYDGLIGILNFAWSANDKAMVDRLVKYGEMNSWVMGEGPREYTYLPQLKIITSDMITHFSMLEMRPSYSLSEGTHNEHLLGLTGWLKLKYAGYLETQDLLVLKNLKQNPFLKALLARVDNGDQTEAIEYLSKFPKVLPLKVGHENWGGCSQWLYFFLVKGILDGQ